MIDIKMVLCRVKNVLKCEILWYIFMNSNNNNEMFVLYEK